MESQITLVNPAPAVSLVFSHNSVLNSNLSIYAKAAYKISTTDAAGSRTDITDLNTQRLLACIQRRDFRSDIVTFADRNDGKPVKIRKWLQGDKLANGFLVTAMETENGRYLWKTDIVRRLVLLHEHDLETPVAYTVPSTSPLTLVLESGSEAIRDYVLVSFLIVEHRMRMEEKEERKADGKVANNRTVLGYQVGG